MEQFCVTKQVDSVINLHHSSSETGKDKCCQERINVTFCTVCNMFFLLPWYSGPISGGSVAPVAGGNYSGDRDRERVSETLTYCAS